MQANAFSLCKNAHLLQIMSTSCMPTKDDEPMRVIMGRGDALASPHSAGWRRGLCILQSATDSCVFIRHVLTHAASWFRGIGLCLLNIVIHIGFNAVSNTSIS